MFDKLIESNSAEAEFKPRRKFFMVSSVVVGILFLSAVVFSLYAQDIDLGTDNFELAELLAPVAPDAPEPKPPRQQPQQTNAQNRSELPVRPELIARIDQTPQQPPAISTTPNTRPTMPEGEFIFDPSATASNGSGVTGPANTVGSGSAAEETAVAETVKIPDPPPVVKVEPKKPTVVSKGVVNGTAKSLPIPAYPAVARAINLTGTVNVQVLIDESGDVVSAKAVDGHAFFRLEAERAARRAKFRPTLLSDVPVKVTGVIVYRFTK